MKTNKQIEKYLGTLLAGHCTPGIQVNIAMHRRGLRGAWTFVHNLFTNISALDNTAACSNP